jgi:hypothetical protein
VIESIPGFFVALENPQAAESSLLSATCLFELFETCSTRTCEIRGTPEIDASDLAGPPIRTGAFIAKKAAETIKKLWMYRCFTTSSFNCVHRCVQQPRSRKRASIGVFESSRHERFPNATEIRLFLHVVTCAIS